MLVANKLISLQYASDFTHNSYRMNLSGVSLLITIYYHFIYLL